MTGLWGIVLAGGDGTRLRALTRIVSGVPVPKQYCEMVGGRSLLERTLCRTRRSVAPARTLVVVNRDHLRLARPQLRDVLPWNLVVQPANRDTGPGLLLPLALLERRDPDATVVVVPSDHWIDRERRFMRHVERAARLVQVRPDRIAVLAVRPTHAAADYGYLEPGPAVDVPGVGPTAAVRAFVEKPDPALAARLVRAGGWWSSFVLVFRVEAMLGALAGLVPDRVEAMRRLARRPEEREAAYRAMPSWNFSHAVLHRLVDALVAVPVADVAWSDWGTPEAVLRALSARRPRPAWWSEAMRLVA
jgi:mannose-1-phosphate guanylyltransferase